MFYFNFCKKYSLFKKLFCEGEERALEAFLKRIYEILVKFVVEAGNESAVYMFV